MMPSVPRLIIGGASKSGTTAVYYYLRQHPDFCLPKKKELHYFSRPFLERTIAGPGDRFVLAEIPGSFNEYLSHFDLCSAEKVAVDISPSYLFHQGAAEEMMNHLRDFRIVFILRNPAEKAFSQYLHLLGAGRETLGFEEALAREPERQALGFADMWLYRKSGYYAAALEHYRDVCGPERLKVYYYDEFQRESERVLREICVFAGVDPDFRFQTVSEVNRSGIPRSALMSKVVGPNALTWLARRILPDGIGRAVRRWIKDRNTGAKPVFDDRLRTILLDEYEGDIHKVEEMIGRRSGWLK